MNLYLVFISIFLLYKVVLSSQVCPPLVVGNDTYDFNQLALKDDNYYILLGNIWDFYFNICGVSNKCFKDCAVCTYARDVNLWYDDGGINYFSLQEIEGVKGGSIIYQNPNSRCNGNMRTTQINIRCSTGPTKVNSIVENPICFYTIEMESNLACPIQSTPIPTITPQPTIPPTPTPPNPTPSVTVSPLPSNKTFSTITTTDHFIDENTGEESELTTTLTTRETLFTRSVTNTTTFSNADYTITTISTTIHHRGEVEKVVTNIRLIDSRIKTITRNV